MSLMQFLSPSSPGSQREPTCMRVQWPKASHWTLWRSKRWRGRPASSTLWPSSGNQRQQRTTPGSITSTVTLCLWVWRRRRRSGGPKPCRDQRSKLHRRCHCRFRSTPVIQTVASSWTLPSFTCSSEAGEGGRSCLKFDTCCCVYQKLCHHVPCRGSVELPQIVLSKGSCSLIFFTL